MVTLRDRLLLVAAALIAFGLSIAGSFHFDDYSLFGDEAVTSPIGWAEVWRPVQTRPLTYFTFWLNYQLGGRRPVGYHVVNLLLHVGCVLLLQRAAARRVGQSTATLAALLFAVHPLVAEPVNYVFARGTLLASLLALAAMDQWFEDRRWQAVAWFAAALLAKEEVAALPVALALLGPVSIAPLGAMCGLALAAGLRVIWATSVVAGAGSGFSAGVTPVQYVLAQGTVIWRYLRQCVVPYGFSIDPAISVPPIWLGAAAWLAVGAACYLAWRQRWALAAIVILLPSSSIFPAADLAADRRMYLPLALLAVAAVTALPRRVPKAAVYGFAAVLATLSIYRCMAWKTEASLWAEAVERAPNKVRPKIQLARASDERTALALLGEARRLAPDNPAVYAERGRILAEAGRSEQALREFGRALALAPNDARAMNNRGAALYSLGLADAAKADFERALTIDPCQFDARYNLKRIGVQTALPSACRYTPEQQSLLEQQQ